MSNNDVLSKLNSLEDIRKMLKEMESEGLDKNAKINWEKLDEIENGLKSKLVN